MKIVNKRHDPGALGVYVGRPSPLGNPYHIGKDGDREQVIDKYRIYLLDCLKNNYQPVVQALMDLKEDDVLICWCHPLPCHAEVIIEIWHDYINPKVD